MRVWLLFLATCFLLGGTRFGRRMSRKHIVVMGFCVAAAASFYNYRVVR